MKIIVGLGNIGKEYKNTRHNIGFEILDRLINLYKLEKNMSFTEKLSKKLKSKIYSTDNLIFVYPQTYMNLSGEAVQEILNWYKIKNYNNLIIIHDDLSLDLGRIKWVINSGAGGQKGVESIISSLSGSKNFPRLKFGINSSIYNNSAEKSAFVLSKFSTGELEILESSIKKAVTSLDFFLSEKFSLEEIMNEFNRI